jgi:hypothetical protein
MVSMGTKRYMGLGVSRDSGYPMLSRASKGVGIYMIQSFRVHGMEDFRASRFKG